MATNLRNLVILGGFSDYFNRFVKRYANLQEYLDNCPLNETHTSKNFNPNDDVNATQILNYNHQWAPNYLLVIEPSNSTIESRWFVLETQRTRGDQYQLTLKRDVLADWYSDIIKAPTFIEKATLNNDDPFIFNSENLDLNRIKKSETLLKDETGIGWIVGYVSRGQTHNIQETIKSNIVINYEDLEAFNNAFGLDLSDLSSVDISTMLYDTFYIKHWTPSTSNGCYNHKFRFTRWGQVFNDGFEYDNDSNPNINGSIKPYVIGEFGPTEEEAIIDRELYAQITSNLASINSEINSYEETAHHLKDQDWINNLLSANGKIIEVNSKIYKINFKPTSESINDYNLPAVALNTLLQGCINGAINNINADYTTSTLINNNTTIKYSSKIKAYTLSFEEFDGGILTTSIDNLRNILNDAPYDMFCIPYGKFKITYVEGGTDKYFWCSKETALAAAQAIGSQGGIGNNGWLYDLQLLPYMPIRALASSTIDLSGLTVDKDYQFIDFQSDPDDASTKYHASILFWATESFGTFDINYSKQINNFKLANETEMYRLVSPNYNGMFEFNAAKMNGITGFNVDFTYKPYNPYIHVNPQFSGLYGQDFDDARGLICGGDFSVAVVSDRWAEYEIQNKNYQNIFDRQITNLEFTQKQERINSYFNAFGGAISGAASGLLIGGGPAGAIAGGALGAAGGIADLAMMYGRQEETKSYQIDMYNMQLGNIKALPYSLTKSSALTANNKIFPFLEFYECTEEEKEAVRKKLYYNGMTVGRIGTIEEFLQEDFSFIQGQLIRLEITAETHVINTIYDELRKGVYIK